VTETEPFDLVVEGLEGCALGAFQLKRMLSNASEFVSDDDALPGLQCVRLLVGTNTLTAVGTDRYALIVEQYAFQSCDQAFDVMVNVDHVAILRQALARATKGMGEAGYAVSAALRVDGGRLHMAVRGIRLSVPIQQFPPFDHELQIHNALTHKPAKADFTVNTRYLATIGKVVSADDNGKHREPVTVTWGGAKKAVLYTWLSGIYVLIMPVDASNPQAPED
jgi:hypothetical protein